MPTPPQIVNQVMEAVNPLWNSNTTIHIGVIAIPRNVHTINAMPFVPFCFAYEAGRNDSSTKLRSIGQHFGNGLHHFVRVVAHLPPFAWRSNINSITSGASLFSEDTKSTFHLPCAVC